MDRLHAPTRDDRPLKKQEDEHRCVLCDGIVELAEYDVYFITGHCRHRHEALEEDE